MSAHAWKNARICFEPIITTPYKLRILVVKYPVSLDAVLTQLLAEARFFKKLAKTWENGNSERCKLHLFDRRALNTGTGRWEYHSYGAAI